MGKRGRPKHPDILTPREWEVLDLLREGLTNEQVGERLGISFATARYHVSEILSKLGVGSREEAARWEPEGRRRWWSLAGPLTVAKAAGVAVVVAAIVGLGVLAWLVADTSGGDGGSEVFQTGGSPTDAVVGSPTEVPAASGTILFTVNDIVPYQFRIYATNADGSGVTALTPVPEVEYAGSLDPVWSPDGQWVAYFSGRVGTGFVGTVNVMRSDGSEPVEIGTAEMIDVVPPCAARDAIAWSGDSSKIAYHSNPGSIRIFDVETRTEIEIGAEELHSAQGPAWSPDGKQLAFNGWYFEVSDGVPTGEQGCKVLVLELATEEVLEVAEGRGPSWSPDGRRIAYSRGGDLYVADVDGSNEELLLAAGVSYGIRARWSPEGDRIATSLSGQLVVMDSDSGDVRMTVDGWNPTWSPDGNWIAYALEEPNLEATPVARDGSQPLHSVMYITRSDGSGQPVRFGVGTSPVWGPVP